MCPTQGTQGRSCCRAFLFRKKKPVASSWTTRNDFFNGKNCNCFYKRKWLDILHIDKQYLKKKSRNTRLSIYFRPSAKGDVICPNQIRDEIIRAVL